MKPSKTHMERVIERVVSRGYVDNFWAIKSYILRLGSVIHLLRKDGWEFEGRYGVGKERKNYYYHLVHKP